MTLSSTTSQKVLIFEVVELVNQVNEGLDVNVTIELTVDTSCYCILDLLYVTVFKWHSNNRPLGNRTTLDNLNTRLIR